jgi:hypothetical protein
MHIVEPLLPKILMDRESKGRSHPHNRCEGVGTHPEVRFLPKEFQGMFFGLYRVCFGIGSTMYKNIIRLNLYLLTLPLTLYQEAPYPQGGTCGYLPEQAFIKLLEVYHTLYILYGRTVVQCYESATSKSFYPTVNNNFL